MQSDYKLLEGERWKVRYLKNQLSERLESTLKTYRVCVDFLMNLSDFNPLDYLI